MSITISQYHGQQIEQIMEPLARLFQEIYRDFPYLYVGDIKFEYQYLQNYVQEPRSAVFIVWDNNEAVGATSCIPLESEDENFWQPIEQAGYDPERILYLGDSVLKHAYRGQGIGVKFFELRENHAYELGDRDIAMFCRVVRPSDHPQRPDNYVPLDNFWRKRGYAPINVRAQFPWLDVGDKHQTWKTMEFWIKRL